MTREQRSGPVEGGARAPSRGEYLVLGLEVPEGVPTNVAVETFAAPLWRSLRERLSLEEGFIWIERESGQPSRVSLSVHVASAKGQTVRRLLNRWEPRGLVRNRSLNRMRERLGGAPLGDDEICVRAFCDAVGTVTEAYFSSVTREERDLSYAERRSLLLAFVLSGLEASLEPADQICYLSYHRDWLIRYPVLSSGHRMAKVTQLFELLNTQLVEAGSTNLEGLNSLTQHLLPLQARNAWTAALGRLRSRVLSFRGEPAYELDPFTKGPLFPTLLRVLHSSANQLGIDLLNEASIYHLLLGAAGSEDRGERFCLAPHLKWVPERQIQSGGKTGSSFEAGYQWQELVAASGDEGRGWTERYRTDEIRIGGMFERALRFLRDDRLPEGRRLLRQIEAHRQKIRPDHPSAFHVLGRFYHGELAYYRYKMGDLVGAYREMSEAGESVRRAIDLDRFLLPTAPLIVDIPLQKARIARRKRDWSGMERHLHEMFTIISDESPLCVLADGTNVNYTLLAEYFEELELKPEHQAAVSNIVDPETRLHEFTRLTRRLYVLENFVCMS